MLGKLITWEIVSEYEKSHTKRHYLKKKKTTTTTTEKFGIMDKWFKVGVRLQEVQLFFFLFSVIRDHSVKG